MTVRTLKFKVEGMTCGHCKSRVEATAKGVSGVADARVDLKAGQLEVDSTEAAADAIAAALTEAGYPTTEQPAA